MMSLIVKNKKQKYNHLLNFIQFKNPWFLMDQCGRSTVTAIP